MASDTDDGSRNGWSALTVLSMVAFLVQAGLAYRRGERRRAAMLVGSAAIAPRYGSLSKLIQVADTANEVRKRLR